MAFSSGIHVVCCTVSERDNAALLREVYWARTMSGAGATDIAVPTGANTSVMFEIAAGVDAFITRGATPPDPASASSPRVLVRAGETRNLFCDPGDKLAWAAA
ncbi:UNVERIFIED_CONTAM: hypothetical protein Q9R58_22165 [Methylobacteriaceae bacterium AG10]|nr:hypothetical protein [Methylobacteriaceae bacterium AG10]